MRVARSLSLLALLTVFGTVTARAQVFTSQSSWFAALSGLPTTVDFSGFAPDPSTCSGNCAFGPFTISGATFNASEGPFIVDDSADPTDNIYNWGTGAVFSPQIFNIGDPNQMFVTLPGSFYAIGFDYGQNLVGDGTPYTVDLSSGGSYTLPSTTNSPWPNLQFWGVVSSTAFNSFTVNVTDGSYAPIFDNVSWGDAQANSVVPEPSTMALMATGRVGMAGAARRRKKA